MSGKVLAGWAALVVGVPFWLWAAWNAWGWFIRLHCGG